MSQEPNKTNPEHSHEFDARLLILEGEMRIISEGAERTYRAGGSCGPSGGAATWAVFRVMETRS